MRITKYNHASPLPFDPAQWLRRRYRLTPHVARLIGELAGLKTPDVYMDGASLKKGPAQ